VRSTSLRSLTAAGAAAEKGGGEARHPLDAAVEGTVERMRIPDVSVVHVVTSEADSAAFLARLKEKSPWEDESYETVSRTVTDDGKLYVVHILTRRRAPTDPVSSLTEPQLERITSKVRDNLSNIRRGEISDDVVQFYGGSHRSVFQLAEHPLLILKLGIRGEADALQVEAMQEAAEVVSRFRLTRIQTPHVKAVDFGEVTTTYKKRTQIDHYTLWVEQRLDGIFNPAKAAEETEAEFKNIDRDPELARKWNELFGQAATFICKTGFWDLGYSWANLLPIKGKSGAIEALGFVDFENVSKESVKTSAANGLASLLDMAPPQCRDEILRVAREHGIALPSH
jgi:hypothetical protein